jgi:hypothetical protein
MLSKQSKTMKSMKRTIFTLLATVMMTVGAGAQEAELAEFKSTNLWLLDSVKVDSMYNYWDAYVQAHPKEELAWRKLFEVCSNQEYRLRIKNWEEGIALHGKRVLPLLERMKAAIPGTYQYYYCAHEGGYPMPLETQHALADSAIALLSEKTIASDYELWVQGLIVRRDTLKLTQVLTRYYESGQYPEEALQYHFNELQGMDEGGLYIGAHEGDIIGKLILQLVLGVHRDKILYDENAAMNPDYLKSVFRNIGIPFDDQTWNQLHATIWQEKTLKAIMRYIFDHSQRPVYLSAHNMQQLILGQGLPDELKARLYNEGLTMRYSAEPYDNRSVKRRNIEQRYRLEYLRMSFHPQPKKDTRRFSFPVFAYAMNYMRLLHDQLPYYKQHNRERYYWLREIFADIICQLDAMNIDVEEYKAYLL